MTSNGQPLAPANQGLLTLDVWPVYMGLAESTDGVTFIEQLSHADYQRGQIFWEARPNGVVVGRARVCLPKGVHTHLLFCIGPTEGIIGTERLEHPVIFDRPGFFDVDPIHHSNYLPR